MARLMAGVAFSGGFGEPEFTNNSDNDDIVLDVDRAAAELRDTGYRVSVCRANIAGGLPIRSTILSKRYRWVGTTRRL